MVSIFESDFEVTGTAPDGQAVFINGVQVEVVDGHSTTLVPDGVGLFDISLNSGKASETRSVVIVRSGQKFTMSSPTRGATQDVRDGHSILVAGTAIDPGGVDTLTVNGQRVNINEDGVFKTTVNASVGMNIIQIEAVDTHGAITQESRAVLFGEFTPFETPVDDAISLRLEGDALNLAAEALNARITPELFSNLGGAIRKDHFNPRGAYGSS